MTPEMLIAWHQQRGSILYDDSARLAHAGERAAVTEPNFHIEALRLLQTLWRTVALRPPSPLVEPYGGNPR